MKRWGRRFRLPYLLALCAAILSAQQLPTIEGESLSGKKVTLPDGHPALLIVGFTHGSQAQTKAWAQRVGKQFPVWSIAVLQDAPRLVRGMAVHGIKSSVPKDQYDRFLVVYRGEKELKEAAGFDRADDAYLMVVDGTGAIRWRYHGPVKDEVVDQIAAALR